MARTQLDKRFTVDCSNPSIHAKINCVLAELLIIMSVTFQGIQDWMLLLGVGCLVAIDLVILVTYTLVEGLRDNLRPQLVENGENSRDVQGVSLIRGCHPRPVLCQRVLGKVYTCATGLQQCSS